MDPTDSKTICNRKVGHIQTKETREKISEAMKLNHTTPEYREKMRQIAKEIRGSDKARIKQCHISYERYLNRLKERELKAYTEMIDNTHKELMRYRIDEFRRSLRREKQWMKINKP